MKVLVIIALFVFCTPSICKAQRLITDAQDTIKLDLSQKNIKNPNKAMLLSAILPGAGQVYNGKPWKVPIIYAGFAANIYFIEYNNRRYELFWTPWRFTTKIQRVQTGLFQALIGKAWCVTSTIGAAIGI